METSRTRRRIGQVYAERRPADHIRKGALRARSGSELAVGAGDDVGVVVARDREDTPAGELVLEREGHRVVEARPGREDGQVAAADAPPARAVLEERGVQVLGGAGVVV